MAKEFTIRATVEMKIQTTGAIMLFPDQRFETLTGLGAALGQADLNLGVRGEQILAADVQLVSADVTGVRLVSE